MVSEQSPTFEGTLRLRPQGLGPSVIDATTDALVACTVDAMNHDARPVGGGILAGPVDGPERLAARYPALEAPPGLRIVHRGSGAMGELVTLDAAHVVMRGPTGLERRLANTPGAFMVDAVPVRLVPVRDPGSVARDRPASGRVSKTTRTASGSRAVIGAKARVARASRILVEGVHDAELVEKVWGDDLRVEGVVVERLDGLDHLVDVLAGFAPGPGRRVGVLVDHLVPGSKEARVATAVRDPHVLVTGTPYVDVWQAVRPKALGIDAWPVVRKGQPWKDGVCAALGAGHPGAMWRRILDAVGSWKDLEQPFVGAVEELIDFVTDPV